MTGSKKKTSIKKKGTKKKSKPNTAVRILSILLVATLFGLIYFLYSSIKFQTETHLLKKLVLQLTPTQSPLLKDYINDSVYKRPADIPESSMSAKIKIPIIMYHYVEYVKDQKDITRQKLAINPVEFEKEVVALKAAGYDTYFARDVPDLISKNINYSDKIVVLTFDDGYEDFYTTVFPILKRHNMRATNYIITEFIGRKEFMNPKQIQEVIDSGLVEIGSHTLTHLPLKTSSDELARKEIFESKQKLESMFNIRIKSFAYPSGSFNMHTVDLVKEAGYTNAVSTISGMNQSEDTMYYLQRVRPGMFNP